MAVVGVKGGRWWGCEHTFEWTMQMVQPTTLIHQETSVLGVNHLRRCSSHSGVSDYVPEDSEALAKDEDSPDAPRTTELIQRKRSSTFTIVCSTATKGNASHRRRAAWTSRAL